MNTTIQPSATSTLGLRRRGGETVSLEIADRATSTAIEVIIPGMSDTDRADWLVGLWEGLTEFLAQWPSESQHMADWLIAAMEAARKNTSKEEA